MTRAHTLASWCAALATILSGIFVSNAQDIKGSIRHTSQAITIDGTADEAAWATANEYTLTGESFNVEGSPPDDDDDLSATWKALWDEDNLYFYAVVTDDYFSNDGPDAWQDDSFELYIDASGLGKDEGEPVTDYRVDEHPIYQLTVLPGEIEVKNGTNHAVWLTRNGDSGDMNAVANTTEPGGYSIEWAIPWSTLSDSTTAEILERGFFGFGMAINDDDEAEGERESQLAWATTENMQWNNPTLFPDVELLFPEGPGPDIFVKSAVDLGRVSAGAAVEFEHDVGNVGQDNTLTISSISVTGPDSDLVTVGELASVAPGEIGKLAVTLDPAGRTGAFDFTIEIQSDDVDAEDQTRTTRVSASVINFTGPAAHYAMDDDAGGTELRDVTGFNRHGILENGATLGGETLATGGSLNVGGGSQGVVPGESLGAITDFTVSMWIQPSELAALQTVFGQGVNTPTFAVLVQNGDLNWFSGDSPEFGLAGAIAAGTKYHVAASYTATQAVLYLDGVPVATQDDPVEVNIDPLDSYFIGAFEGGLAFSGVIDDVQFYDRVITAEDVAELFAAPGTVLGASEIGGPPVVQPPLGENLLVNGSFEEPAVANINSNNLGTVPTGWSQTGDDATWNLIRNDGTPYDNGVDNAAEGSQIIDLNGEFEIFQNFTLAADADVTFGASFANRSGHDGDPSTVGIYDADGATLLSPEVSVDTSAEPQPSEVWASGEATVSLAAGEYRIIVDLNNWNNVDAVFASPIVSPEAWSVTSDFEGLDAGTVNGQDDWVSSAPDTTLVISDDGNQVLEVTAASQNAYRPLPSAIPSGTTGTVFFRARPGDLPDFVLGVSDVAEPGAWDDYEGYMRFAATNMDVRDGGGFATVLENFSVDTWYNIWLVIDNTALETTLYYSTGADAAQLGGTGAFRMTDGNTEHGDIISFLVRTGNAHITGQVDDIYVDVSGENLAIPQSVLDGNAGGGGGDPLQGLTGVNIGADGSFGVTIPDGVTADVEYSTDLIDWETIANGVTGPYNDADAARTGNPAGFYRAKQ